MTLVWSQCCQNADYYSTDITIWLEGEEEEVIEQSDETQEETQSSGVDIEKLDDEDAEE